MSDANTLTKCYLLSLDNGEVQLKCPTTSRSTMLALVGHILSHVEPKEPLPWAIHIEQAELASAEFAALRTGFNTTVEFMLHGKLEVNHEPDMDAALTELLSKTPDDE